MDGCHGAFSGTKNPLRALPLALERAPPENDAIARIDSTRRRGRGTTRSDLAQSGGYHVENGNDAHLDCGDPDYRWDRGCAVASTHDGSVALHHRGRGSLYGCQRGARVDGAEGSVAYTELVLARSFQRTR